MRRKCFIYTPMTDELFLEHVICVSNQDKDLEIFYSIGPHTNCKSGVVVSSHPANMTAVFIQSYTYVPHRIRVKDTHIWVNSMFNASNFGNKFFATECDMDFEQMNQILKRFTPPNFQDDLKTVIPCEEAKNYAETSKRVSVFLK